MHRFASTITLCIALTLPVAGHASSDECRQHTKDAKEYERRADATKDLLATLKASQERASEARKEAEKLDLDDVEDKARDAAKDLSKAIDEATEARQRFQEMQRHSERLRDAACKR